uniref:Uncharacterized protein n=1 Tax=Anguilla anguilla TaxID=7936 RepID=A0A0E9UUN9_ANGAN
MASLMLATALLLVIALSPVFHIQAVQKKYKLSRPIYDAPEEPRSATS